MPDCVPPVLSPAVPAAGFPARSSSRRAQAPASGSITVFSWVARSKIVVNPFRHVIAPGIEDAADHAGVRLIQPLHRCLGYFPARRSEEHTSELQSRPHLVCRLLLEKKKYRDVGVIRGENEVGVVVAQYQPSGRDGL